MSKLDDMLTEYGTHVHHSIALDVGNRVPVNVALRLSTGEEILIALLDTGREMSIDIDGFDADGDRKLTTFTFPEKGHTSPHIDNLKTIVMMRRENSKEG
jgi:hypothetical protein